MKTKKYRHLFFDLDRTLWDYDLNAAEALAEIYQTHNLAQTVGGLDSFRESFAKYNDLLWTDFREGRIRKNTLRTLRFERILADFGITNPDMAEKLNTDFLNSCPRKANLIPGTIELLDYLKEQRYSLHIITNGFIRIQRIKMESSGIADYFQRIFSFENTGGHKPHRAIFAHAVTSVNARKVDSLMIGDDMEVDIVGARNYGIDQVYFNPGHVVHSGKTTYEVFELSEIKGIV
ncbi:MAG: YjjG family noncanonical pyrimidine nucleotidase [Bacteroidota bacterium]|nr:YjjG family noncanonical pyrimidine nucleotidase [Bacteroidota bacterium]